MEKLARLSYICNGSVYISINDHRSLGETVKEYIDRMELIKNWKKAYEIGMDVYEKMVNTNFMIELEFYPHASSAYRHTVYHYDLELALDVALNIISKIEFEYAIKEDVLAYGIAYWAIVVGNKFRVPKDEVRIKRNGELYFRKEGIMVDIPVNEVKIDGHGAIADKYLFD